MKSHFLLFFLFSCLALISFADKAIADDANGPSGFWEDEWVLVLDGDDTIDLTFHETEELFWFQENLGMYAGAAGQSVVGRQIGENKVLLRYSYLAFCGHPEYAFLGIKVLWGLLTIVDDDYLEGTMVGYYYYQDAEEENQEFLVEQAVMFRNSIWGISPEIDD